MGAVRRSAMSNWRRLDTNYNESVCTTNLAEPFKSKLLGTLLELGSRRRDWHSGDECQQGHDGHEDEGAHYDDEIRCSSKSKRIIDVDDDENKQQT